MLHLPTNDGSNGKCYCMLAIVVGWWCYVVVVCTQWWRGIGRDNDVAWKLGFTTGQ